MSFTKILKSPLASLRQSSFCDDQSFKPLNHSKITNKEYVSLVALHEKNLVDEENFSITNEGLNQYFSFDSARRTLGVMGFHLLRPAVMFSFIYFCLANQMYQYEGKKKYFHLELFTSKAVHPVKLSILLYFGMNSLISF